MELHDGGLLKPPKLFIFNSAGNKKPDLEGKMVSLGRSKWGYARQI